MRHVIEFLTLLVRLVRPARGLHAGPRALRGKARPRRASRVRRYASDVPIIGRADRNTDGAGSLCLPVPDPCPPMDTAPHGPVPASRTRLGNWTPIVRPEAVNPPADIVRGHYRAHEARTRRVNGASAGERFEAASTVRMAS